MAVIWLHYTNTNSGGRIPVIVEWDWNVLRLKDAIFTELCRTPDKLIFAGRELDNSEILRDLSIEEFSTVYCVLASSCNPSSGVGDVWYDSSACTGETDCESKGVRQLPPLLPRKQVQGEQRTDIPASPGAEPVDTSDIHVEVPGEYYVQMGTDSEHDYLQMNHDKNRDSTFFNTSFRYLTDTDSIVSGEHLYERLESFALHSSHLNEARRFFSVYCSDICCEVTRGKLRVRCWRCKSGQFILSRDPCCWDDVRGCGITGVCCSCRGEGERAEFYFKCTNHQQDSTAIPLKQVKMNEKRLECIICGECPDRLMVFECISRHVTCLPCFREYVRVNLLSRQFSYDRSIGYSLGCPAGCEDSLLSDQQHFRLLGAQLYETLHRFAAEEYVLAEGGVLCPAPGCGEGVILTGGDRLITCEACCHMFCRRCMLRAHFGVCENTLSVRGGAVRVKMKGDMRRGSWRLGGGTQGSGENESGSGWTETSGLKSCPNCNSPVQRDGGCTHMKCAMGVCHFEWCWVCEKQWTLECREDHWFD